MSELAKAVELIQEKGWGQGHYVSPDTGCYCTLGSLYAAIGAMDKDGRALVFKSNRAGSLIQSLSTAIHESGTLTGDAFLNIPEWNDKPNRTKEQVIAVLRRADEIEDNKAKLMKLAKERFE